MARRPRARASTRLPKTLTGILASLALAVLAALGVKTVRCRLDALHQNGYVRRSPSAWDRTGSRCQQIARLDVIASSTTYVYSHIKGLGIGNLRD